MQRWRLGEVAEEELWLAESQVDSNFLVEVMAKSSIDIPSAGTKVEQLTGR